MYGANLDNPESAITKTLGQSLSKYFGRTAPPSFQLNTKDGDYEKFEIGRNPSMKVMIVAAMMQMPNNKGCIKDIKLKVMEIFPNKCGGEDWETTFVKTLSRYKDLFIKSCAVYQLNQDNSDESLQDVEGKFED